LNQTIKKRWRMSGTEKSAIVLLSGGLDSTVCLWWAKKEPYKRVVCLTFLYGSKEEKVLKTVAKKLGELAEVSQHEFLTLDFLADFARRTNSALIQGSSTTLPHPTAQELEDFNKSQASAKAVWIPGRNLLFLAIAAAYAETLKGKVDIITGFNLEEGTTFPDNTQEFIDDFTRAASRGILKAHVQIISPLAKLNKAAIIKLGKKLATPFEYSNSCYEPRGLDVAGRPIHCAHCESCQRRKRGFKESAVPDPTIYTPISRNEK